MILFCGRFYVPRYYSWQILLTWILFEADTVLEKGQVLVLELMPPVILVFPVTCGFHEAETHFPHILR